MRRTGNTLQAILALVMVALLAVQCSPAQPAPTAAQAAATEPATTAASGEATAAPEATQAAATTPATSEADRASVFVYENPSQLPDLDPAISYSNDLIVMANAYETLTVYNAPGSKETLSPGLATSWEHNADGTEWTFHLRDGVTFSDGTPFNADAVKFSVENTKKLGVGAAYIWDAVKDIQVVDPLTVKFILSYSAPLDLIASSCYAAWMYSPKAYQDNGQDWFQQGHSAGTGPYVIESYDKGSRLVMTRNEKYWGGWKDGQFQKVIFEITQDPVVLQQKIVSGDADFTYSIPPDNVADIKANNKDIVVYTNPSYQNLLALLNTQKPPLDNKDVRQALAYSFPYTQFIQGVMGDRATQAHGPVPANMWGHSDDLMQYQQDLNKAKELLTKAGYPNGGFKLQMTFSSGDMDEQQLGEVWKAELAKLGIDLEVQGMNWDAQWELGKSDPKKAQDIFLMYWWPDYMTPYTFLKSMFHSEDTPLFNLGYYKNPNYDKLIDQANEISGTDKDKAASMFVDAQKILLDDCPALFFYDVSDTHLVRSDIKGYVDNPAYPHAVFVYQLTRQK